MGLFQKSVLNKYLKLQDATLIDKAYKKYCKYFHNIKIQQNILISKEEQFQQKFLIELFEKVFDYTIFPDENFNITTEFKNLRGAKKADGAILVNGKALCVIELKGTNTKDLESIRQQAFDYKSNHPTCKYIITSNFEKIRFYIETSDELEEFNLFTLTKKEFELLYLCVQKDNLLNNIPLQIKKDSIVVEENITKKFYNDYSLFKRELYRDLVKQNLKNPIFRSELQKEDKERATKNIKLNLFKKSQKLIDRFLFIFFAEDRGLLPPNSTLKILNNWDKLTELEAEVPLYNRFKLYFKYLDIGRQGTNKKAEIFAYNGGLFKPDAILDSLILDDNLLYKHTKALSDYDFESQVDVNILGHIFENSLNEIESVNAEIEGTDFDKQKTKRKKDGVFYTPKYITKYIVDNTVGKLCEEKKTEFTIVETEFTPNRQTATKKRLLANLESYRTWLLQITICDPACGSGAFLNQALDFLIKEHSYLDELQTKLLGGGFVFPNIENTVLENNIFGVDLNEESVEIAKLSLWLRTAQPRRKLNSLNDNIKCGNSLIDSKAVAGNKAFHWETEFPNIFKEKDKKIYHITTAIHDSRTSARMEKYQVRERREMGTNPYPNVVYFTADDDLLITQTIAKIVTEDNLQLLAYNICADHIHLLLACEIEEIAAIMQKVKGRTSYDMNKGSNKWGNKVSDKVGNKGFKPLAEEKANKPLWQQKYSAPKEVATEEQLQNTIRYIQKNRAKHELPEHSKILKLIIENMCCTVKTALETDYKGGFDVVIGNPPYVGEKGHSEIFEALKKTPKWKEFYRRRSNTYYFFIKLGIDILKEKGIQSLIIPREFSNADWANKVRKSILESSKVIEIVDFSNLKVFSDAGTTSLILSQRKVINLDYEFPYIKIGEQELIQNLLFDSFNRRNININSIKTEGYKPWDFNSFKIDYSENKIPLSSIFNVSQGIVSGCDRVTKKHILSNLISEEKIGRGIFILNENIDIKFDFDNIFIKIDDDWIELNEEDKKLIKPYYKPENLQKWSTTKTDIYIIYVSDKLMTDNIKKYLLQFEKILLNRSTITDKVINLEDFLNYSLDEIKTLYSSAGSVQKIMRKKQWYLPLYERASVPFDSLKIVVNTKNMDVFTLSENDLYSSGGGAGGQNFIYPKLNTELILSIKKNTGINFFVAYVNAILNSKLIHFLIHLGQFNQLSTSKISDLPIRIIDYNNEKDKLNFEKIVERTVLLKNYSENLNILLDKFKFYLNSSLKINTSKTLQNWHDLDFADFIKELNKAIKTQNKLQLNKGLQSLANPQLTKLQEMDWMEVFEVKKAEAQTLKIQIEQTDKEIDQMVYELYGLTDEEIAIVENS